MRWLLAPTESRIRGESKRFLAGKRCAYISNRKQLRRAQLPRNDCRLPTPRHGTTMMLVWPERADASGLLFGAWWCQPIGGAFHEADDPYDIIDVYWSLLPLKIQTSLRCLDKSLRVCIGHKPMPALSLPSCVGANFATKFYQHVVPLESYAPHLPSL
jgi:hypothetical protein